MSSPTSGRCPPSFGRGIETLSAKAKVGVLAGTAVISAPGTVVVTGTDGESTTYTADHILRRPPARRPCARRSPGRDLPDVLTSDQLLEGTDAPMTHRYHGWRRHRVEFATFYNNLGCQVTLVEGASRLLPTMDKELGQNLGQLLKKRGVEVLTSAMVQRVEQGENGLGSHRGAEGQGKTGGRSAASVRHGPCACLGRTVCPRADAGTGGEAAEGGCQTYQTSIPTVYAIGDLSAEHPLAHVASAQAVACVNLLCGEDAQTDLNVVPSCIYSSPEIAVVGLTEAEAKEQGVAAVTGKCIMFRNARTMIEDPGRCFMKLVADKGSHEILGAQLMCQHASDMISQISEAMVNHLTAEQMLRTMRPHPSFEEAMLEALEALTAKLQS